MTIQLKLLFYFMWMIPQMMIWKKTCISVRYTLWGDVLISCEIDREHLSDKATLIRDMKYVRVEKISYVKNVLHSKNRKSTYPNEI